MSEAIIRPLDIERDCQKLADLFNESEPAWPGGFTGGLPLTEANVREWMEAERTLVTYVAEDGERLVGFCSFLENTPWPTGQYDSGYLDLLNVHPDYHGQSIGRRLLQATIERSVKEGWVYQTLGTWSANFKSVPAYKKTGHFWRPDTSVWMQNFIPGALQMPLARPFFDRHDWYRSYVRVLEQHPDDERWEGLKVYREHWEADGESLTIWIDREAQAPCAIETDDVFVAAIPRDIEPLQGTAVQINWRILNKRAEPLHAHIHALGADGLTIDHREAFVVPPGLSVDHVAEVQVTAEAPHAKLDGSAPAVRSIITLDHDEVELFSGLRARKPLSVDTDPGTLSLRPGVATSVVLQVHSQLPEAAGATCYVIPSEGLEVDWRSQPVTLEARRHAALSLSVRPVAAGIHALQVRLAPDDAGVEAAKEELTVFAVPAGGVLAQQSGDSARLETDSVRLDVSARFGTISLTHKDAEICLLRARPAAGPPYFPNAFDKNHFSLRLEREDGRALVHMQAEPEHYADSHLQLTLSLAANGLLTVEQQMDCLGAEAYRGRLIMEAHWGEGSRMVTTPLAMGYVRGPSADFPCDADDTPADPDAYAEPWIAVERDGVAAGAAWSEVTRVVRHGRDTLRLMSAPLILARGERSAVARYAFWTGRGDWRAAREVLLHWAGLAARREEVPEPEARSVVRAATQVLVYATIEDELETVLTIDSAAARIMDGVASISGAAGLVADPERVEVKSLSRAQAIEVPVRLRVPRVPGCYQGHVTLDLPTMTTCSTFQVLRLGSPGAVSVENSAQDGRPLWTVQNGLGTFTVAPDYGPSVMSWVYGGQEQLVTSYPTPRGHAWSYPWYGGIQLRLFLNDDAESCGNLVGAPFDMGEISSEAAGLTWRGVRLSTRPERKELHDLGVEMDYLTLPNCPVLKAVLRLTNLRPTRQTAVIGGGATFSLGGDPERLELRGEHMTHRPTPWSTWVSGQSWGTLTDPVTGASVLSACPQGKLGLSDTGRIGREFALSGKLDLAGGATRHVVWYFYLADGHEQALAMKSLAAL
ncbi:MAG: GNAT family N-acetyltransferase [Anaerolineae bacterium]